MGERERRALEALTRDTRSESPPDADWDGVRARVLRDVRRGAPARWPGTVRPRTGLPLWAAAAVALFGVGTILSVDPGAAAVAEQSSATIAARQPRLFSDEARLSGENLMPGDRVRASASASTEVHHEGHVTWRLSPGGAARLITVGEVVSVSLDSGVLTAIVTPSATTESFSVKVDEARIAVHGTVFTVTRLADHFGVDVTEGVVSVSSLDGARRALLRAPTHGRFDFDGTERGEADESHPEASEAQSRPTAGSAAGRVVTRSHADSAVAPARPAEDDVSVLRDASRATQRCFVEHTPAQGGLRISVDTTLQVAVEPDGSVLHVRFDPPLAPPVERCMSAAGANLSFKPATNSRTLHHPVTLAR